MTTARTTKVKIRTTETTRPSPPPATATKVVATEITAARTKSNITTITSNNIDESHNHTTYICKMRTSLEAPRLSSRLFLSEATLDSEYLS